MTFLRLILMVVGLLGTLVFGGAFILSATTPLFVEGIAKEIIRQRVEQKVHEKIDALDENFIAKKASHLIKGMQQEVEATKQLLRERLPEKIAAVMAEMADITCECRMKIASGLRSGLEGVIASKTKAQEHLTALIRTKYMETAEKLTHEFRIFTGTNAVVFALLALAAYLKRGAGIHLAPPAIILVLAATVTAYLYVFGQNWLHTIVFNQYVGFAYVAYMAVVFFFLCDVLFNRGRVTTTLVSQALNAIGSSITIVPC